MHDAPPPPLDRQGIGRLLPAPFERSDITLNDAFRGGLRDFVGLFHLGDPAGVARRIMTA